MKENIYGHNKKLEYILGEINEYRASKSVSSGQVNVLDVGCGNGTAVTYKLAEAGYNVHAIDVHKESIEYAARNNRYANLHFELQDVEDLIPTNKYDVVVCSDIVEHLPAPRCVLRRLSRMVKPDGLVICTIPNGYGPFELERKILDGLRLTNIILRAHAFYLKITHYVPEPCEHLPYNDESIHLQFFTYKRFAALAESSGLKVYRRANGSFVGAPISSIFLKDNTRFIDWNVRVSNRLPVWMVSVWYFTLRSKYS